MKNGFSINTKKNTKAEQKWQKSLKQTNLPSPENFHAITLRVIKKLIMKLQKVCTFASKYADSQTICKCAMISDKYHSFTFPLNSQCFLKPIIFQTRKLLHFCKKNKLELFISFLNL